MDTEKHIILGVAAHPDDLDFGGSGTIAKWIEEGAEAYFVVATDGSKGSDDPTMTTKRLIAMREQEQRDAAKVLGVKDVFFLHYPDTELQVTLELKEKITYYIRKLKPTRVVTMDPILVYSTERNMINHSDHRAIGQATVDAVFPYARDRLTFPHLEVEGLEPHKVKELYLMNYEKYNEIVDITSTFDKKIAAIKAHVSQVKDSDLERVKDRASEVGEKHGFTYAEHFIKIKLE